MGNNNPAHHSTKWKSHDPPLPLTATSFFSRVNLRLPPPSDVRRCGFGVNFTFSAFPFLWVGSPLCAPPLVGFGHIWHNCGLVNTAPTPSPPTGCIWRTSHLRESEGLRRQVHTSRNKRYRSSVQLSNSLIPVHLINTLSPHTEGRHEHT